MKKQFFSIFFIAAAIFFIGCGQKRLQSIDSYNMEILESLRSMNNSLNTFKGFAKMRFINKNKSVSANFSFAGSVPDKMRIILMDPIKRPIESISYDGKFFYYISYRDNRFYKKEKDKLNLKSIIGISAYIGDIVCYMAGKFAPKEKEFLYVDSQDSISALVFKDFSSIIKIYFDNIKKEVVKIESFGFLNKKNFTAEFSEYKKIGEYNIPFMIFFRNDDEGNIGTVVEIEKYLPNENIKDSVFVINPK